MPIAGLTTNRDYGFPRLGKIRKGDVKPVSGKAPGKDLDYFRFTTPEGREWVLGTVERIYGDQPKELKIWLPYETVEENFDPWMKEYGTGSVKRICDGSQQVLWLPEGSAKYKGVDYGDEPIPCAKKTTGCRCQRNAALKVMLVELFSQGICGYFDLVTSSEDDIRHIHGVLNYAFQFKQSLLGVPLIVRRLPEAKSVPLENKRVKKEFSLIRVEVDPAWVQHQIQSRYQQMMGVAPLPAIAHHHDNKALTPAAAHAEMIEEEDCELPELDAIEPEIVTPPSFNKERFASIAQWTGFKPKKIREISRDLDLPDSSVDLSEVQCLLLRDEIFIQWGLDQGVFNAVQHARNSFKNLMAEFDHPDPLDDIVWLAWQKKVSEKMGAVEAEAV